MPAISLQLQKATNSPINDLDLIGFGMVWGQGLQPEFAYTKCGVEALQNPCGMAKYAGFPTSFKPGWLPVDNYLTSSPGPFPPPDVATLPFIPEPQE